MLNPLIVSILYLVSLSMCSNHHRCDVTRDERAAAVYGKTFELTQDMFLIQDYGNYSLAHPGTRSSLPVSVEEFRNHPNDWHLTEAYRTQFGDDAWQRQDVRVVEKGTKVEVVHVEQKTTYGLGTFLWPWGKILTPEYQDLKVLMGTVFREQFDDPSQTYLIPDEHFVKECRDSSRLENRG